MGDRRPRLVGLLAQCLADHAGADVAAGPLRACDLMTVAAKGVVAAGHRLTAEVGAEVLRDGGNAFDAAIAAMVMACVCEPVLCSPGGGGFAMVGDGAARAPRVIDFFPHTPRQRFHGMVPVEEVFADFGTAVQGFHIGPATAATPGFFAGVEALHGAGATAALADLFAPAVRAARAGVTVTPFQHHLSRVVEPILRATPGAASLFAPGGSLLPAGARFSNPTLADALEILASDGFAESEVGLAAVSIQSGRGHLRADDLAAYSALERTPLRVGVGEMTVHLNPLPAAGGALVAHSLRHLESGDPVDIARALCATDRARRAADGDLAQLAAMSLRQRGTTHISVIDADGTACAVTVSNGEGNGELVDRFGFMLNNVLGEEDVNPAGAHDWPTDTRLSSMMCPTMIERADGGLVALGSGGSNRIRSAILQVVVHLCLADLDLREAVEMPRLHVENERLDFEDHHDGRVREELVTMFPDHLAWPEPDIFFGGAHAARRDARGGFAGVGDARRDGAAIVVV